MTDKKEDKKADLLETKVSDIQKSLEELKTKTFSEIDKKNRTEEIKSEAEITKQEIQAKIDQLKDKKDADSVSEREKAETLLKTLNNTITLQLTVWEQSEDEVEREISTKSEEQSIETQATTWTIDKEEKWFFWKIWDWMWVQWNKTNENPWKYTLGATGLLTTWMAIEKAWNRIFWKKKKDSEDDSEKEETKLKKKKESGWGTSRWKKFLIWAWITTWSVVGWVEVYKHWNRISSRVKEQLWLALSFNQAIEKVESEVHNWKVDADHFGAFNAHFEWWITYDEKTKEICSYWERTKIEKNWKKLQWMDVEFASWEELIHAANIVNFAKRRLIWRWATPKPFWKTSWWWDISFKCSAKWEQEFISANGSNEWSWILWTLWTAWWWILWWYCAWVKWAAIWAVWWWTWWYALWAYIDNTSTAGRFCKTISRWKNLDEFIIYLNNQTDEKWKSLRESKWEQHIDSGETPINSLIDNWWEWIKRGWVLAEIEKEYWEDQTWRRNLEIKWWWNEPWGNPEEYKIVSYGHELKLTLKGWPTKKWEKIDYNKITKIHIEKYENIDWKKIDSRWDWLDIDFPHTEDGLKEAIRTVNLTNMIVEDRKLRWTQSCPFTYWKYKTPFALEINASWSSKKHSWWTAILNNDTLKTKFPTLHKDLTKFPSIQAILPNFQKKMWEQAADDKSEGSQYIKFLHQLGKWKFWKK